MNLAFVVSHNRTILFHAVARKLERDGHSVFWISPSPIWSQWLIKEGVSRKKILETLFKPYGMRGDCFEEFSRFEVNLTARAIFLSDRIMRRRSQDEAICIFSRWANQIEDFLINNEINVVLSEKTWAVELIADQVCLSLGIPTFNPHTIRIPATKFAFFYSWGESEYHAPFTVGKEEIQAAEEYLHNYRNYPTKPWYFHRNDRHGGTLLTRGRKLLRHTTLLRNGDKGNPTRMSALELASKELGRRINRWRALKYAPFRFPVRHGKPYILLTLHRQPEASIDVLASKLSNQFETIRALSRILPANYMLYVKEHSNALGDRGMGFYREVARLPGVQLVHPRADTVGLIRGAQLVLSATGTASFEAALLGVPAATMVKMFFSPILERRALNPFCIDHDVLKRLLETDSSITDEQRAAFIAHLHINSFEAITVGPDIYPAAIEETNVDSFYRAITVLLETLPSKPWAHGSAVRV